MSNDFSEDNVPQSNWMKFDNVGDICKGTIVNVTHKSAQGAFSAQTIYNLTNAERGTSTIVDEKVTDPKLEKIGDLVFGCSKDFINNRLKNVKPGDTVAFAFIKTIKSGTKGYADAKSIVPFVTGKDEEYLKSLSESEFSAEDVFE